MRFIAYLVSAVFLSAANVQAATLTLDFQVTVDKNECAGDDSFGPCSLTFDGLDVGDTYNGQIVIADLFAWDDDQYLGGEPIAEVDLSTDISLGNYPGAVFFEGYFFCTIGGIECYGNQAFAGYQRKFFLEFDYLSGEGQLQIRQGNLTEEYNFGGETILVDDQGRVWQSFYGQTSIATATYQPAVVPLPASSFLLLIGLSGLAGVASWKRRSKA